MTVRVRPFARARRAGSPPPAARLRRPVPPDAIGVLALTDELEHFVPAPELERWAREVFISGIAGSPIPNADHGHLALARLGFLWTNAKHTRQGRIVLGTAEIPDPKGGAWQRARQLLQLRQWFGDVPDFVITISAPYAVSADDASFCALVEHELYHCGQAFDQYGAPRFNRQTGAPVFRIRGHDVEEFVGVVRRYGARAAGVEALVQAAREAPLVAPAALASACGTCLARAA